MGADPSPFTQRFSSYVKASSKCLTYLKHAHISNPRAQREFVYLLQRPHYVWLGSMDAVHHFGCIQSTWLALHLLHLACTFYLTLRTMKTNFLK